MIEIPQPPQDIDVDQDPLDVMRAGFERDRIAREQDKESDILIEGSEGINVARGVRKAFILSRTDLES